jgi:uncharacterized NAD-dependent epimerase/dehydratase family protein
MSVRKYLVLAPGAFATRAAKTAHGVIAYGTDVVVAVVDPAHAGKRVRDVMPYLQSDAPIVATVALGLAFGPTALLVGTAPQGGKLPPEWRAEIVHAIDARLEIVSGLHDILAEDAELAARAEASGSAIWDVRVPPPTPLFSGAAWDVDARVLLTVGSDCAVGKMTVSLELAKAARDRGTAALFVPTGQTGIMIAGWGIAIDRVIADFAPGAAERLVLEGVRREVDGREPELLIVEGQGGINHPAYAPVTLALLYGSAPDALVLVHNVARTAIDGYDVPLLSYRELIRTYEMLCGTVKPARVVGIALNTSELEEEAAQAAIAEARSQTGLPADDVVRYGPHALYDAIAPHLATKTEPRTVVVP